MCSELMNLIMDLFVVYVVWLFRSYSYIEYDSALKDEGNIWKLNIELCMIYLFHWDVWELFDDIYLYINVDTLVFTSTYLSIAMRKWENKLYKLVQHN